MKEVNSYYNFFKELFSNLDCGAIFHKSGLCLHLEYEQLYDIGCLPKAFSDVQKYMPMNHQQMIILNDPYSGGGILTSFTLLYGLNPSGKAEEAEFVLCKRFQVRPQLQICNTLDEEGLRIPPTPIMENNKINEELISAMLSHPLSPTDLKYHLDKNVQELLEFAEDFLHLAPLWKVSLEQKKLENYINDCNERLLEIIAVKGIKKTRLKESWPTSETINLELSKENNRIIIDFEATNNSEKFFLTRAATFGACIGAIFNLMEFYLPINSGTTDFIDLNIPKDSFLNSSYPKPVYLGFSEASKLIANLVSKAMGKAIKDMDSAGGAIGNCTLDISFNEQLHFFDRISSGLGARKNENGSSCVDKWSNLSRKESIEEIEKRFPLQIRSSNMRQGSGGQGKFLGGDGMCRSYLILEKAKLKWFISLKGITPDGLGDGTSGLSAQIIIYRNKEKIKLEDMGEFELQKGDRIDVLTAGGGGYT